MTDQQNQGPGPGKGIFTLGQRIITLIVSMVETRIRLVVVELEQEKANIIQLLMMAGITLLLAAFGLMSLLILVIWAVDPQYRLAAIATTTGVLFLLAIIGAVWTLSKARQSTLLSATREELLADRNILEKVRDDIQEEENTPKKEKDRE